jgi:hypothetical protein
MVLVRYDRFKQKSQQRPYVLPLGHHSMEARPLAVKQKTISELRVG